MKKTSLVICVFILIPQVLGNAHAQRLYDDLLSGYNKLIRPVQNSEDAVTVRMGMRLSQIIDIDEKNQIMTTKVWIRQEWFDHKLTWDPHNYGNVKLLYVPSELIWLPDIVLYNNADGNYEVILMTKATLYFTGLVIWEPPAIYKSSCTINVEWFPFDEQTCTLKFGSWTYDSSKIDLRHIDEDEGQPQVTDGMDLSEYVSSAEWDILAVPAQRNTKNYPCCPEIYSDITFQITIRRKTLFYTVNLIVPCVVISFLTVVVFYLPSDSGERVALSISILIALTVFFLVLLDIIPPTSLVIPLIGKYLLFTMILVTLSVCVTIIVLNVHFRSPSTHKMSPFVRKLFLHFLPKVLLMKRPTQADIENEIRKSGMNLNFDYRLRYEDDRRLACEGPYGTFYGSYVKRSAPEEASNRLDPDVNGLLRQRYSAPNDLQRVINGIRFIANRIREEDAVNSVKADWKYVAMVLDRLFLYIFMITCFAGTLSMFLQAPSLYDTRIPLDQLLIGT